HRERRAVDPRCAGDVRRGGARPRLPRRRGHQGHRQRAEHDGRQRGQARAHGYFFSMASPFVSFMSPFIMSPFMPSLFFISPFMSFSRRPLPIPSLVTPSFISSFFSSSFFTGSGLVMLSLCAQAPPAASIRLSTAVTATVVVRMVVPPATHCAPGGPGVRH